jgi:uncharacterized membrane protein YcgQ (UPF0703/DUF1980 family)
MKKILISVLLTCVFCGLLAGYAGLKGSEAQPDDKKIIEIKEKMFVQQCFDIYENPDDYEDKLVKIEGICDVWEEDDETLYAVYRRTPGCCGDDGVMGFQFTYNGTPTLAADNWISVTASVLLDESEDGYTIITLAATDVTVMEKRGKEFVSM